MVESWMDRIARPAAAGSERMAGQLASPQAPADSSATGWDPYEVWYRQVKQVRDRSPEQYAEPVMAERTGKKPERPAVLEARSEDAPRWRLRIAGLLPRSSG